MNSCFSEKGLMTALGASAIALGSFAAVNAYATDSCLVCWSPGSNLCQDLNQPAYPPVSPVEHDALLGSSSMVDLLPPVMWMSCYEKQFTEEGCGNVPGNYETYLSIFGEFEVADNAWWYNNTSCGELKKVGTIPSWVKLLATGVNLTAKVAGKKVKLELTTSAEPDTAALTIIRGNKLGNGGTEIDVACKFDSAGTQNGATYNCTDDVVGDTYQVLETEYDGSLIIYGEVTPE